MELKVGGEEEEIWLPLRGGRGGWRKLQSFFTLFCLVGVVGELQNWYSGENEVGGWTLTPRGQEVILQNQSLVGLSIIGDSRRLMRMPKQGAFSLLEEFPLRSRTATYALPIAWDGQMDQAGKLSARPSPQTLLSCKMTEIIFTHGNFHSTPCTNQSSLTNLQFRNCSQLAGAPLPGQLHEKLIKFNGCHFLFQSTFYLKLQEEAINCSVYHGFKKKWKIT